MKSSWFPHGLEDHRPEERWDDLLAEPTARGTGVTVPAREQWFTDAGLVVAVGGAGDIELYSFSDESVNEKELRFQFQMPHKWDGSALKPHVHWVGETSVDPANPRWGLQYTWAGIGANFTGTRIIYGTARKVGLGGQESGVVTGRHYISALPDLEPNANQDGISSILLCRLFRNSGSALDTYTGKCGLLYFDLHYRVDARKPGSRTEYVK